MGLIGAWGAQCSSDAVGLRCERTSTAVQADLPDTAHLFVPAAGLQLASQSTPHQAVRAPSDNGSSVPAQEPAHPITLSARVIQLSKLSISIPASTCGILL